MFNYIKQFFLFIYNYIIIHITSIKNNTETDTETETKTDIKTETETEYIERELNTWKVKMYSENSYLIYIPEKRVLLERNRIKNNRRLL